MKKIKRTITCAFLKHFRSNADVIAIAIAAILFTANLVAGLIWSRV